jgi:hypothetical protein
MPAKKPTNRESLGTAKRRVRFPLTIEEQADRGHAAGERHEEIAEELALQAGQKTALRKRLEILRTELGDLARACRDRNEKRDVTCDVVADYASGVVEWISDGTVVDSRPMTAAERQGDLLRQLDEPVDPPELEEDEPLTDERKAELDAELDGKRADVIAFVFGLEDRRELVYFREIAEAAGVAASILHALETRFDFLRFRDSRP